MKPMSFDTRAARDGAPGPLPGHVGQTTASDSPAWARLVDGQFDLLQARYRPSGGLREGNEVAQVLRSASAQPISKLARWIVDRRVVCIFWRSQTHIPMFQFDIHSMMPREGLPAVLRELTALHDDWGVALWFSEPSVWLAGKCPADVFAQDAEAVQDAARRDRFIARG